VDPYALIPLTSCVLCTGYCLSVWTGPSSLDDRRRRAYTRGLMALFALYTGFETAFKIVPDSRVAHVCLELAGWTLISMGPVAIMTALRLALRPHEQLRRVAMVLYAIGALLLLLEWRTGLMFEGIVETSFGIRSIAGPLYYPAAVYVLVCGGLAFRTLSRAIADSPNFEAHPLLPRRMIRASVVFLLLASLATDVVLPLAGIEAPGLASLGFGLIALSALWTISQRDGGHITATPGLVSEHILHALNEGVAFLSMDGRVLLANESIAHLVGVEARSFVGQPMAPHLPDLELGGTSDRVELECELHAMNGHTQPVSVSISTVRDGRGTPLGRVVVVRDVRELKTIKNRLVMSGRLAAVGQMAAGIAHEINNPISFVRTNLGVLKEHWQTIDAALVGVARDEAIEAVLKDGEELIAESVEGVDRAAGIVRDVRELSHVGSAGHVHGNLNHILERVIRLVSSDMGTGVSIERRFGEGCRAQVSPDQITQVFVNLLTNAVHAVQPRGHIIIESRRRDDQVEVRFIDDGHGVADEIRERIFDPFYTTKEVGAGTGLGLSISHEIVRGHGGELVYTPNESGGACFTVYLAASPERDQGVHGTPEQD
jgi:signal transduction histidine kinase